MSYFSAITTADRVCFEGEEVTKIIPIRDRKTGAITHYQMSVRQPDRDNVLRKFRANEIPHLLERELLVVEKGYYSLAQQTDRVLNGSDELFRAGKKQRDRIDLIMFLCRRMGHHHALGMPLTPPGVEERRGELEHDFRNYQARVVYGTEKSNSTQNLKPLPANTTLLEHFRKFRKGNQRAAVFLPPRTQPAETDDQKAADFLFILRILYGYADPSQIAKSEVAEKAVDEARDENERRKAQGNPCLIKVKSARTYERWIDMYLDPFTVSVERDGFAAAKAKFGSVEQGLRASFPGEQVQFDAWNLHVITLDTTRARYNNMTANQRAKVKRVRRWVVVAIDVATRAILGFAFCRSPNQAASLAALRMCYADKTFLLEQAGLRKSTWNYRAPIHLISTDSGSEFGKHPFGGALFGEAVRTLSGTLLNAVTGVPELRAHIERLFLTFELKWARHLPGWTAGKLHLRNDRNPQEEACMTDDELERLFVQFIADYHASPHRGLRFATPAGTWEKLSENHLVDVAMMPGPRALREACGIYQQAGVSEAGIRWMNLCYSNEYIRDQRTASGIERLAEPGEQIEIKVDPMDVGAISVLTKDDCISVPCLDTTMVGKSLSRWKEEQARQKAEAAFDVGLRAEARSEARTAWRGEVAAITSSAGKDLGGRTPAEIARLAHDMKAGKGVQEKPFVGRDEYDDPIYSGFQISDDSSSEVSNVTRVAPTDTNHSNPLDRFRSKSRKRPAEPSNEEKKS